MLEKLLSSTFVKNFLKHLESNDSCLIDDIWDSPKAMLCLAIKKHLQRSLIIISGRDDRDRLLDDIKFFSNEEPLEFPAWETLPDEDLAPSLDIIGKRYEILHSIASDPAPKVLVTSLQGILQKLPEKSSLTNNFFRWRVKDTIPFDQIKELLECIGYTQRPITSDKGEFSLRGGILDIFPMSALDPCRIEFFGDDIEQIKTFDPITQKSIEKTQEVFISPADEQARLKSSENLQTLWDYFHEDALQPLIVFDDLVNLEDAWVKIKELPGSGSKYCLSITDLLGVAKQRKAIYFCKEPVQSISSSISTEKSSSHFDANTPKNISFEIFGDQTTLSTLHINHPFFRIEEYFSLPDNAPLSLQTLNEALHQHNRAPLSIFFVSASESEQKKVKATLNESPSFSHEIKDLSGYLTSGFVLPDKSIAVFPFVELSHHYKVRRKKWRNTYHTPESDFHEILPGDYVVHFHNGVGKFLGIEKQKNHEGSEEEFLVIEYASQSKLFVPLSQSHLVSRYIGSKEETPTVHTLGTSKWQNAKVRAQNSIIGYAKDLLQMQAQRETSGGFSFENDSEDMLLFEEEFPFVETDDQLKSIASIKTDMMDKKSMDRLVCGDVGYGKTEVAMRAAFKAVINGQKQVAVLVPTTTLAMQHYETFCQRMANFPITIKPLSRFVNAKDAKKTLEQVKDGSVDILIGTHRLISKSVAFNDLGLIIIDEEQRFGVRAKEHLKKAKIGVDCLTLSATPIPRTLYMSLIGIRDLSVINTPPQDRLPIKTIMAEMESTLVKNALLREIAREGQAYFIHNRVDSIFKVKEDLQKLIPTLRIKVVHGQMPTDSIDEAFHSFKNHACDVLLATSIVESGIDIPNANTMIIDRADRFGLADLYQLRGRVGRWNRPAYCYFLTPPNRELNEITRKRMQALVEISGFGGGMKLALRDLELRGAGDILGVQQSGQVSAVGFHLYCKLLKQAVKAITKKTPISFIETKLEFAYPAYLPESYIKESSLRQEIYHKLGDATEYEEIDNILSELSDRFGKPPSQVVWLYHMSKIRIFGKKHLFALLKFEKKTLIAHRHKGKVITKKNLPLIPVEDGAFLEHYVTNILKQEFRL